MDIACEYAVLPDDENVNFFSIQTETLVNAGISNLADNKILFWEFCSHICWFGIGTVTINVCLFTIYIDLVLLACLHNKQQIAANKQKVTTHSAKTYTAPLGLQN